MDSYSSLFFVNNTAYFHGGAIFLDSSDPHEYLLSQSCFIQRSTDDSTKNLKFHFEGNKALSNLGNDVFASSVNQCTCEDASHNTSETFDCIGQVTAPQGFSLATKAQNFEIDSSKNRSIFSEIVPGLAHYDIPIIALDEYEQASELVYDVIRDNPTSKLRPRYNHISENHIQFDGELRVSESLSLKADSKTFTFINITSAGWCSPGFNLSNDKCQCEAECLFGISHCEGEHAFIIQGFWMGKCSNNSSKLCTSHCPLGFCVYGSEASTGLHKLPLRVSSLDLYMCGRNRTGVLCGSCRGNHSAFYHSYQYSCGSNKLCRYGILLYMVSELLPLTLMFFVIIIFDIDFNSGSINGFIFFAQVLDSISVDANGAIVFPDWLEVFTSLHRFVYRTLNFDFFSLERLSFCLWEGATTLDAMVMKYVTILYAMGLLVLLIVFMNVWKCKQLLSCWTPRTIQSSAKKGLTAFIVICYSQCARVSFQILSPGYLYGYNYERKHPVAFRRGDYLLFDRQHLKYAFPAVLIVIVMSLIPLLLIFYPLIFKLLALCKLSESKLANVISRMLPIPLLDSFQSSFKDNFRCFAGLYFLYRLLTLAAFAYSRTLVIFYTLVELILIIVLVLHSVIQPYKVVWHNAIDSLIFGNLAIINGITLFNYFKVINGRNGSVNSVLVFSSLQALLIYLPMLCIVLYFAFLLFKKCKPKVSTKPTTINDLSSEDSISLPPLREDSQAKDIKKQALLTEYTYGM